MESSDEFTSLAPQPVIRQMPTDVPEGAAKALIDGWAAAARELVPNGPVLEAHAHLGVDVDGSHLTPVELFEQMRECGVQTALAIPLHHPEGYADANPEVARWAAESGGRLLPLWRLDPARGGCAADARAGFEAGAVGLKLHPRAEAFAMDDPELRHGLDVAAEHNGVVLIHGGRGMPALGRHVLTLASELPDATFILAHAAVSDLSWIADAARDLPNIVFDTSWWNPNDLGGLLATVEPSRILFATDPPYGTIANGMTIIARVAAQIGYNEAQLRALFGGNLIRILGRTEVGTAGLDLSAASIIDEIDGFRARPDIWPASWAIRRCAPYLIGAMAITFVGADPDEQLALAEHALDVPQHAPERASAHHLRQAIGQARIEARAGNRRTAAVITIQTLVHAATADLGVPPVA